MSQPAERRNGSLASLNDDFRNRRLTSRDRLFRVMMLGSLYFKLCKEREATDETLDALNKHFQLVDRLDSLWVPAILQKFMWKGLNGIDLLSKLINAEMSKTEIIDLIKSKVPPFVHYPNMQTDIERMLAYSVEHM